VNSAVASRVLALVVLTSTALGCARRGEQRADATPVLGAASSSGASNSSAASSYASSGASVKPASPSAGGDAVAAFPTSSAPDTDVALLTTLTVTPGTRTVRGRFGVVTSVEAHATRVGVEILEAGGNAADAAVAVAYALAVTHPSAGNIGGGGFMLVKPVGEPAVAIEFREQAPLSINQRNFDAMIAKRGRGVGASGLPGSVAGYNLAARRWGTRPLRELIAPAIRLAQVGHPLGERQALVLGWSWPELKQDPQVATTFGRQGKPLAKGEPLRQPALARTLEEISARGDEGFYAGAFADAFVRLTANTQWPVTREELASYEARLAPPLTTTYRQLHVETAPPPSAGGVAVVSLLALLEREGAHALEPGSAMDLHLFAEAAKRAHSERRFGVADPATNPGYDPLTLLTRWRNPDTWLTPFPISRRHATPAASLHPLYESAVRELDHTTHFSVVDRDGMVVSCTTTLSGSFGARYMVPGTGVFMNNSVGAFSTAGLNVLAPGRRMTSSMAPTIVSDAAGPVLVLGSPGGDTIPNTVVSVFRLIADHRWPLDKAVDQPRIHHGFVPDAIRTERLRPIPPAVRQSLVQLGHSLTPPTRSIGDANNLARTTLGWEGYADPREGGLALAASLGVGPSPSRPSPAPSPL
jgi:gamma-glutamyltranspeptidase/glutathione hydrolase